ncbi:hypothetical protein PCANC_24145 [Puccinia coronata f. sp. avenae]|uniref:Uncharacterized protein n=1 Tax=Puccinia coronata f. sp. avenae TaxID=200324 RepID=A0A2N5TQ85_9BASI|nr:hypothetical protein PCANC_24145 [Puccinia coronata f. sp. avenae]
MPVCLKCKSWSNRPLVGDVCFDCLRFLGVNVKKMNHLFSAPSLTPSTSLKDIPPPNQNNCNSFVTVPSQRQSLLTSQSGTTSLNVLKPALHSQPRPTNLKTQEIAPNNDSGTLAHFCRITKEKRVKPSNYGPSSKRAKTGSSSTTSKPQDTSSIKHQDFGFLLYESGILLKNTGIHRIKLAYDINNANLYNELCTSLWTMFSPQIIKKTHIKSLPPNPEEYLSLSDAVFDRWSDRHCPTKAPAGGSDRPVQSVPGTGCTGPAGTGRTNLSDQLALASVGQCPSDHRSNTAVRALLEQPCSTEDSISDPNSPSPKRYATRASITTSNSSRRAAGTSKKSSTATTWALGPLAGMQALFLEVLQSLKLIEQIVRNYDWSGA